MGTAKPAFAEAQRSSKAFLCECWQPMQKLNHSFLLPEDCGPRQRPWADRVQLCTVNLPLVQMQKINMLNFWLLLLLLVVHLHQAPAFLHMLCVCHFFPSSTPVRSGFQDQAMQDPSHSRFPFNSRCFSVRTWIFFMYGHEICKSWGIWVLHFQWFHSHFLFLLSYFGHEL